MLNDKDKQKLLEKALAEKKSEKVLSIIGFAMRAGKLVTGTDKVCDEIRRHGNPSTDDGKKRSGFGLVLIASDASENTVKRITNCCKFYNVKYKTIRFTSMQISDKLGKLSSVAVLAAFDKQFIEGIEKSL